MFGKIKKEIIIAIVFFEALMMLLWTMSYFFLQSYGFSSSSLWFSLVLMFAASMILGYIFASYLLESKYQMERNLIFITDEIIHELNIPLTTITANTNMLSKTAQTDKDKVRLERIEHATIRLKRLYESLVYTITKEITPVQKEEFELSKVIKECSEPFLAQERNEFIFDLMPIKVIADKIGFEQVLENIISNAMKHSPIDKPINIVLRPNKLEIIDNGDGMDDTEMLHIYERYYQGDIESDGRGIGLAVVKNYCDNEGINITIYSKKGEGTRVILDISKIITHS
ncbi:MAG: HAMP domain-containing sensor histidine kinase [Sulfurovaceae bacterium]|nr:HAMP domain-containing sensor histidine kinase [Sulfurovaceae bacterium]